MDGEEKIICPYNAAHHIMRKRMNTHLVKCRRNYTGDDYVECDFNVQHKILKPELQWHHQQCPDRHKIEITVYQEEGIDLNKYPISNIDVPTEESWDDYDVPSYNPSLYCENKEIIRHKDTLPAAQRKEFRRSERQRVGQLLGYKNQNHDIPKAPINARVSTQILPSAPNVRLDENTPETITQLMRSVQLDKGKCFIPKQ